MRAKVSAKAKNRAKLIPYSALCDNKATDSDGSMGHLASLWYNRQCLDNTDGIYKFCMQQIIQPFSPLRMHKITHVLSDAIRL